MGHPIRMGIQFRMGKRLILQPQCSSFRVPPDLLSEEFMDAEMFGIGSSALIELNNHLV